MDIRHGVNRFYIKDDEKAPLAEMTYVDSGEHLVIIDHTEAGERLKGQGAGRNLLKALVDWARAYG